MAGDTLLGKTSVNADLKVILLSFQAHCLLKKSCWKSPARAKGADYQSDFWCPELHKQHFTQAPSLALYVLRKRILMELAICWPAIWTNLSDIIYRRSAFKWAGWYSHPSHCSSGLQGLPVDCHSHDTWQARSLVGINQHYFCLLLLRVSLDIFSTAWFMPQLICFTFMVLLACLAKILKHC